MRVAVLAHGGFPAHAKTALGVIRYGEQEVAAVLAEEAAGTTVADHVPDLPPIPVVSSLDAVAGPIDALLIGVAPIGGGFEDRWRPDVRAALERGLDVVSGLHYLLAEDEEFAALATEHGGTIHDVRDPPDGLGVSEARASETEATVVLTVGTDCGTGKMTTTFELLAAARDRGLDAGVAPTGQTGIMVAGHGVAVDRVIADFAPGAVESVVLDQRDRDVLFVEGQGSIVHPAYAPVTLALLHGAMPDALVLTHEHGRERVRGYESFALPPLSAFPDRYASVAAPVCETSVEAGALNTSGLDEAAAEDAVAAFSDAIDAPAADPVRDGPGEILEAVL